MKVKFDSSKFITQLAEKRRYFINVLILLVVGVICFSVYTVVVIKDDQIVAAESKKKQEELNISFDKKYLQELQTKKSPTIINEVGGRNPFIAF